MTLKYEPSAERAQGSPPLTIPRNSRPHTQQARLEKEVKKGRERERQRATKLLLLEVLNL
jgi:hypothetical protein